MDLCIWWKIARQSDPINLFDIMDFGWTIFRKMKRIALTSLWDLDYGGYTDWNLQEELGTEYLVQPLGRAEDEEHSSDFEPQENGDGSEDEEIDEEDVADDGEDSVKVQSSAKRKRSGDDEDDKDDDGDDDDDGRPPSKRYAAGSTAHVMDIWPCAGC